MRRHHNCKFGREFAADTAGKFRRIFRTHKSQEADRGLAQNNYQSRLWIEPKPSFLSRSGSDFQSPGLTLVHSAKRFVQVASSNEPRVASRESERGRSELSTDSPEIGYYLAQG